MPISLQFVVRSTLALLGVGFVALMFVVLATMWLSERAETHLRDVASARELRSAASLLREGLLTAETSQRGYVLTGNEIYLAPYDNAKTVARSELEHLRKMLASTPERHALVAHLSDVVDQKIKELDTTIALKGSRKDSEASDEIKSNRGKALMDEANVYLSAVILETDERVSIGVAEQTSNTAWLRWTSAASALVIMLVVSGVLSTLHRYTREILLARDEVRKTNEALELRVTQRTAELARARDRAEILLEEVNHRVANSLALVSSLVKLQARAMTNLPAKEALSETDARIQAIAQMHRHLFTTGSVGEVAADSYLEAVIAQLETGLATSASNVTILRNLSSVTVPTSVAVYLGVIVTEWVTNAVKYAYPDGCGEVRVRLDSSASSCEIVVEDDGVGRENVGPVKGTGFGTRIVSTIAAQLSADVQYRRRNPGTEAHLSLALDMHSLAPAADG